MDNIFGIGLPELFFIAILALVILGPERLPSTLRQVAKAWGYMRNLGRELTSQFSEEFKALEDLNPRKILNELADEELTKDLKALSKGAKPSPPATSKATTPKPAAKPATTTSSTTSTSTTAGKTSPVKAKPADSATKPPAATNSVVPSDGATNDGKSGNSILPPPAEPTPAAPALPQNDTPVADEAASRKIANEAPGERTPLASAASVSVNGAANPAENGG